MEGRPLRYAGVPGLVGLQQWAPAGKLAAPVQGQTLNARQFFGITSNATQIRRSFDLKGMV